MTNYEKVMSVATPTWIAYLMANVTPCDRCPLPICIVPKEHKGNLFFRDTEQCMSEIKEWLESEVKE